MRPHLFTLLALGSAAVVDAVSMMPIDVLLKLVIETLIAAVAVYKLWKNNPRPPKP